MQECESALTSQFDRKMAIVIIMFYSHDIIGLVVKGFVSLPRRCCHFSLTCGAETSPIKNPTQRVATNPFSARVKLQLRKLDEEF